MSIPIHFIIIYIYNIMQPNSDGIWPMGPTSSGPGQGMGTDVVCTRAAGPSALQHGQATTSTNHIQTGVVYAMQECAFYI